MVEGWRPRSWAQLGQQQRSRSGFSTLDSARAASASAAIYFVSHGKG